MNAIKLSESLNNITGCYQTCLQTLQHCIEMGEEHTDPDHLSLLQDCIDICRTTENFMLRNSEFTNEINKICASICEKCADSCEKMATDDEQMQECADSCRGCAASCRGS